MIDPRVEDEALPLRGRIEYMTSYPGFPLRSNPGLTDMSLQDKNLNMMPMGCVEAATLGWVVLRLQR